MLGDLEVIADSGINHITHYELNIAGRSDFSTKKKTQVPSISQKIEMYHASKEYLISRNYKQITVYDWEYQGDHLRNRGKYLYESNLRDFIDEKEEYTSCMGGIGYAAINFRTHPLSTKVPSCSSMNHRNLERYYDDINNDVLPIERSFFHEGEDLRMIWLFQALQEMKIDVKKYNSLFTSSLNEFEEIWKYLEELGWLSRTDEQLLLIKDGEFYVPLIQSLLSSDRIEELRKRTSSKSTMKETKEVVWLKNA